VEVQVREARLTDIDRITALLGLSGWRGGGGVHPNDVADLLRQLVYLPNATVLVALDGRQVVGAGALCLRPSVRHGGLVGSVDLLVVDPGYASDGVAEVLLAEQMRSARNKGCVIVEAGAPEDPAERQLLEENGFTEGSPALVRVVARARALAG
jgi:GNAT superfamily N-acetyltransferase